MRYLASYFPPGHNRPADAALLWKDWRCALVKNDFPAIPIAHGQPAVHWRHDLHGRLGINLEDMWSDFEYSVNRFVSNLRGDLQRRDIVLRRWQASEWSVERLISKPRGWEMGLGATVMDSTMSASVTASTTTVAFPRRRRD